MLLRAPSIGNEAESWPSPDQTSRGPLPRVVMGSLRPAASTPTPFDGPSFDHDLNQARSSAQREWMMDTSTFSSCSPPIPVHHARPLLSSDSHVLTTKVYGPTTSRGGRQEARDVQSDSSVAGCGIAPAWSNSSATHPSRREVDLIASCVTPRYRPSLQLMPPTIR